MIRLKLVLLTITVMTAVLALAPSAGAQSLPRCIGGCDAEYSNILTYDPYAMWATYGYPTYSGGCWWYDVEGTWWYMCPPDGNLYPSQ